MSEPTEPLGDIEVGFSLAQAAAIVREIDALWDNSNIHGKRKVKELRTLRATLAATLDERETNP